jgi:hypothetical protein
MEINNNKKHALKVIECVSNPKFYEILKKEQKFLNSNSSPGLVFIVEHNETGNKIIFDLTFNEAEKAIISFMKDNNTIFESSDNCTEKALINNISMFINDISTDINIEKDYFCKIKFIYENNQFNAIFTFLDKPTDGMLMFFDNVNQIMENRAKEIEPVTSINDSIRTKPLSYTAQ